MSDIPGISIRSALFALKNQSILADPDFMELDRKWKRYRARNGLDAYGNPAASGSSESAALRHCQHAG